MTEGLSQQLAEEIPTNGLPFLLPGGARLQSPAEQIYLRLPPRLTLGVLVSITGQTSALYHLDIEAALRAWKPHLNSPTDRAAVLEIMAMFYAGILLQRYNQVRDILGEDADMSFLYAIPEGAARADGGVYGAVTFAPSGIQTVFCDACRMDVAQPVLGLMYPPPPKDEPADPEIGYMVIESLSIVSARPFMDVVFTGVRTRKNYTCEALLDLASRQNQQRAHLLPGA